MNTILLNDKQTVNVCSLISMTHDLLVILEKKSSTLHDLKLFLLKAEFVFQKETKDENV